MIGPAMEISGLSKSFIMHTQGRASLSVLQGVDLTVWFGRCLALVGPSGAGKSTLLRCKLVDMARAEPRQVLEIRRRTLGFVSQFLRVVPRVPAEGVVAEPLLALGLDRSESLTRARRLLARLNISRALWGLSPTTFSGGEQQRINVARTFIVDYPILLLDEPTAFLDEENKAVVIELISEAKVRGATVVGIFHDRQVRLAVADDFLEMSGCRTS